VPVFNLPYKGKLQDEEAISSVRQEITRLIPNAVAAAESLLNFPFDWQRIDFELTDSARGQTSQGQTSHISRMATYGIEFPIVAIRVQPILRGDYADSNAVFETLTHEMIHAIIRQNIPHDDYHMLPEWFQEGVPTFLVQQGEGKLLITLAIKWDNPVSILEAFDQRNKRMPYLTGYFFFAELDNRLGRMGTQAFIRNVLLSYSITAACDSLQIEENDIWQHAKRRASFRIQSLSEDVGSQLRDCMKLYQEGQSRENESQKCFQELIEQHPETYAGQVAHYWLAKIYMHRHKNDQARFWFDRFLQFPVRYGLYDNVRYFRIRILMEEKKYEQAKQLCEQYLLYFPDGDNYEKAKDVCSSLSD